MAHVFISYSRKNQPYARQLAEDIRKRGFDVWIDDRIDYGDRWWRTVVQAIQVCGAFVVVMSPSAEESEWVEREVLLAQRNQKPIFPVLLEGDAFALLITTQFANVVDGNLPQDDFYERLRKAVTPLETSGEYVAPSEPQTEPTPMLEPTYQPAQTPRPLPIVWIGAALLVVVLVGALLVNGVIGGNGSTIPTLDATPATQAALQPTDSPTDNPTLTLTPTESPTPDVEEAARQLLAQQTAQAIIDQATATAARATQDYALNQTQIANLTATATLWTATPTPNMTASVEAVLTRWAQETQTQASMDATATATLWTPTPTPTITPTPTLAPVTRNADWTPQSTTIGAFKMMRVPPGCFDMGENGEGGRQCFDTPFWIGKTEVTNAQYAEFVSAGGYNEQRYWTDAGWAWKTENNRTAPRDYDNFTDDNQPRVGVSWYEAVAYTQWLNEQLRASGAIGQEEEIRLPTESEWEYAARGPDGLTYPWGNDWDAARANVSGTADGYGDVTAPVGSYPLGASWVGALDMSGNVWEWSLSDYAEYPYVGTDSRNDISGDTGRVLRGGSWGNSHYGARAAYRGDINPDNRDVNFGFRVLRAGG